MGVIERRYTPSGKSSDATRPRPHVLWINCRLLHPLIGGDRLRTFHMLRRLKSHFEITYVCPITEADEAGAIDQAAEYCDTLIGAPHRFSRRGSMEFVVGALKNALWGDVPYMAQRYVSPEIRTWLMQHATGNEFDMIVCDYLVSHVHLRGLQMKPPAPVVVFQHNVESLIWQRHAENATHPLKRWIFKKEAALTFQMEANCAENVAGQITVSPEESAHFQQTRGMPNILGDVPTGVDSDYFQPAQNPEPHTMAFLGSMDWEANCLAVRQFIKICLPTISAEFPTAKLLVIGRNPPEDLRAIAESNPAVTVTGTVADVRPHLARASMMILPLQVGGGTRVKVYEAMAAGLAVVSTPIGVEGLPVSHGEHALIAEMGAPFTEATLEMLRNAAARKRMAAAGRLLVERHYSWEAAAEKFKDLCTPLLESRRHPKTGLTNS